MQERIENISSLSQEQPSIKEKIAKLTISALMLIACPGDDIVALSAIATPLIASETTQAIPTETILGLFWTDKAIKQTREKEDQGERKDIAS